MRSKCLVEGIKSRECLEMGIGGGVNVKLKVSKVENAEK